MPEWDSALYLKFEAERTQPCRDLAARIALPSAATIMDLGCGPGNSTEVIAARFPGAAVTGLDSSPDMIAKARARHPEWNWVTGDIAELTGDYDLIFSNAALQWVPDHARLFPRLLSHARVLAVQVPANWNAPAHALMRDTAREFGTLERVNEWFTHDDAFYYDVLAPHCTRLDLWATEYLHVLPGPEAIVEWYRGTGMRPFLEALPDDATRDQFTAAYAGRIQEAFPPRPNGKLLFSFRRLFLIAYSGLSG
jgi:trans-aconitate 2-methyltransferase